MGCLLSCFHNSNGQMPLEETTTDEPKVYSWDKRDRSNLHDFIIDGKKGETIHRLPGTVNGEQILIQNCENSTIYIFDHTATVSVDDCTDCSIFIGPSKASVFIRDCKRCKFAIACQQFRTRDCFQIDTFLLCATQPIIESSGRMRFGCFQYFYSQLEQQLKAAGLSIFNNNWSNIHDFTPTPEEINFSLMPEDVKIEDCVAVPSGDDYQGMDIKCGMDSSVIPVTWGGRHAASNEACLVIFFNDGYSSDRAIKFIRAIKSQYPHCLLTRTKEVTMGSDDANRVTGSDSYSKAVTQGPVIGLEINGASSVQHCQAAMVELMKGSTGLIFVSQSIQAAEQQIEHFFTFADMQMGL